MPVNSGPHSLRVVCVNGGSELLTHRVVVQVFAHRTARGGLQRGIDGGFDHEAAVTGLLPGHVVQQLS